MPQKHNKEFILGAIGVLTMYLSNIFLYTVSDVLYNIGAWGGWLMIMVAVLNFWGVLKVLNKSEKRK